ncbi:kynureninase [Fulvivirga sp. M361]|uniref:kynureninase n=1 Tax=Fulvivirga sp. M361 TaxID=2594266 RepID=UPI00117B4089|nr:kynureninase [Fulvivirga sp. M361]TRX61271.1 kynureninase [Fulvivirga sp. M361]
MTYENSLEFALRLDEKDHLKNYRSQFHIPQHNGKDCVYFTGNSLGLQPKTTKKIIEEELSGWATLGVEGHFHNNKRPWFYYHQFSKQSLAQLLGAKPVEVVSMNNLTSNLHLMLASFYRPTGKRCKILIEGGAFPSDQYAVESQIKNHGYDWNETLIEVTPRTGEYTLRTEDIIKAIEAHKDDLALVLLGGVQYFTGQLFDFKTITKAAHKAGAFTGFDLAHAIGNVPMQLHDDNVDFAVWCSYKYLNSGPGGVSGVFIHEKHGLNPDTPRLAGWWGHDESERFKMEKGFKPMPGADGWQLSNVNILSSAAHLASLEIFDEVGIESLSQKSKQLTGFLEFLLNSIPKEKLEIITPENPAERGCQLSILVHHNGKVVFDQLSEQGVITDWREPHIPGTGGVIRVAPVPLYNTYSDVYHFYDLVRKALQ